MTSLGSHAPRRYFVDAVGRRVLIGLTLEETSEFERLDSSAVCDAGKQTGCKEDGRWLELYAKHEGAWKAWMAQSRAEQPENFSLY